MKKKLIISSVLIVLMLMMLPTINAFQTNIRDKEEEKPVDLEDISNMDIDELLVFIIDITQDYPEIQEKVLNQVDKIDEKPVFYKQLNSNQSIIQKIWQLVFNYRMLRFSICALVYITFPSKITMLRTLTWSIKVIRWIKVGVILSIIDPDFWKAPEVPEINFEMDMANNTLTVQYINTEDVLWSDIDQIGSGNCDPFPSGTVAVGDMITNCQGIIVLRYIPTNGIIDVFEFT